MGVFKLFPLIETYFRMFATHYSATWSALYALTLLALNL